MKIVAYSFPDNDPDYGLEPSLCEVLAETQNDGTPVAMPRRREEAEAPATREEQQADLYFCTVYMTGVEDFCRWATKRPPEKIVVGGYQPTLQPDLFIPFSHKIVLGPCNDIWKTIDQPGQVVRGVWSPDRVSNLHLWPAKWNQQTIPEKPPQDVVSSLCTSFGCHHSCAFCCSPFMSSMVRSKTLETVAQEVEQQKERRPKWLFIRDENFLTQPDWNERLRLIGELGARLYLFASADTITLDIAKTLAKNGVYMVCLGLEDITQNYAKNKRLDEAVAALHACGVYVYLSYIVNPLVWTKQLYRKLYERIWSLLPEMISANFLLPFPRTAMWKKYGHLVPFEDYRLFDSKHAVLVDKSERERHEFELFWYQWKYYTSKRYNAKVRKFDCGDTLWHKFDKLRRYWSDRGYGYAI